MSAAWVVWTIIGGGNAQTLLAGKKMFLTLCTLRQQGHKKISDFSYLPSSSASTPDEPPGELFTI